MEEFVFIKGLLSTLILFFSSFILVFGIKSLLIFTKILPVKKSVKVKKKKKNIDNSKILYVDPTKINKILVRRENDKSA
jgi:hypothetical protein